MSSSIMKIKSQTDSIRTISTLDSTTHSTCTRKVSVRFDTVEVREYPMILDESKYKNPFLTIDWEAVSRRVGNVDQFERSKGQQEPRILEPKERLHICVRSGYPVSYIRQHLAKPNPYIEDEAEVPTEGETCKGLLKKQKPQKKSMFSKMKFKFGKSPKAIAVSA
ncbi:expressed unknown protein [Seminavis robusta]|uniref:Uncharacterized protein n=1 Tax=Seminavis robusta TaxID=568900 RepID=A0A9N8DRH0_9STRA|nr:expressed unknown protein [Seminavis robusta]|eukprot:Sro302_g112270.1 n/a (165) ;mRNA; r:59163-59657